MKKLLGFVTAVVCTGLCSSAPWAGPNADGTLIVAKSPSVFCDDLPDYCGSIGFTDCYDAIARHNGATIAIAHPTQGGSFGDDGVPAQTDPIAGFGRFGFGTEGSVPCPVAEQLGACCFADGSCDVLDQVDCGNAGGTFQGDNTVCDPNPCAQPTGACCYADGSCVVSTRSSCEATGGVYQGDFTVCNPNPCDQPTGACCYTDGTCVVRTRDDCAASGGDYQGDDTVCDPTPCSVHRGACCYADGSCVLRTEDDCGKSGQYQGDDTTCDPNPCSAPRGACCVPTGFCYVVTQDHCGNLGGDYAGDGTTCQNHPCVSGACCFEDGLCELRLDTQCLTDGGEFMGEDTVCQPNPCRQPNAGACCLPYGFCVNGTPAQCQLLGGYYLGDQTLCADGDCPIVGACCTGGGFCTLLTETECDESGGTYINDDVQCVPNPCPEPCSGLRPETLDIPHGPPPPAFPFRAASPSSEASSMRRSGPNAGGTLILHSNPDLVYTGTQGNFCGLSELTVCEDANARRDVTNPGIIHLFAAFPLEAQPRLSGAAFGVVYDPCIGILDWGACSDFELPDPAWPLSGTGNAVTWSEAQTGHLIEIYWFAAYTQVEQSVVFGLAPHSIHGAVFADDDIPSNIDPIAALGSFGFYTDGNTPCPSGGPPRGACCLQDRTCVVLTEDTCLLENGEYRGDGTTCDPDPCAGPPGACCFDDGTCEVLTEQECKDAGGSFYGDDGSFACEPNPCTSQSPGACCLPDGSCQLMTQGGCGIQGGVFLGEGTDCTPNPCEPVPNRATSWGRIKARFSG